MTKYYYYNLETGEYAGYGVHLAYDSTTFGYTTTQVPILAYDFDIGNTQQAYWTGSEWEVRDI